MPDSKYFSTTNRGELFELKQQLNSHSNRSKRDALKQVIASMTVGKDVSSLFTDVLNCMQTVDLELKKLVYLYLINYAKTQPDLAILAVNTFVKDASDPNPLIRTLALRTMGCIQLTRISEYLCEPLRRALKDADPYVRKTAAICVAKLYEVDPALVSEYGFIGVLKELILDSSPMVVANAIAALGEIDDSLPGTLELRPNLVSGLLQCLNDCSEWGQIFIIDAVSSYVPSGTEEAESIIERLLPRLQHANAAVVLSSMKVIVKNLKYIKSVEFARMVQKKLGAPLVTLVSAEPEVQYVALRNINLLVRKYPEILQNEFKAFFCKYNDPPYIKEEKLEILVRLANDDNATKIISECKEYAAEVDVGFVRASIRAIGRIALKIEAAANKCVECLLDLVRTRVVYVVQESIVVMKDIMRRYPNEFEGAIPVLCENLEALDEPNARASLIWIIGEYADRIENIVELVESFLENFQDESVQVQQQLLTCATKVYLKCNGSCKVSLEKILNDSMKNSDNADLRDRAFFYSRLLQTDKELAKSVVLSRKPRIVNSQQDLDDSLLNTLLDEMGSLASVFHRSPHVFLANSKPLPQVSVVDEEWKEQNSEVLSDDILELSLSDKQQVADINHGIGKSSVDELFDLRGAEPTSSQKSSEQNNDLLSLIDDLFSNSATQKNTAVSSEHYESPEKRVRLLLPASKARGLEISGVFTIEGDKVQYILKLQNESNETMRENAIQFNKNLLGMIPSRSKLDVDQLKPKESVICKIDLRYVPSEKDSKKGLIFQMALKNDICGVVYFGDKLDESNLIVFLQAEHIGKLSKQAFLDEWNNIGSSHEVVKRISVPTGVSLPGYFVEKLYPLKVFQVASSPSRLCYFSARVMEEIFILVELHWTDKSNDVELSLRCNSVVELLRIFEHLIERALSK
ncbi:AP-1 complex subunit beta-1 [Galdieria sulphuraria]|uniref:AP complex subunit beta n=1 Tax=Galdieria sulphuraria TaxID=130081 RepID=M2Y4C5_GALSU|nr:AP-1 complex subunit beta-1 [Galdieria sulphuraria]EME30798.1 AP-1 complex subunit beta-1 [Galdieria sulphuraria]|eukprot:XP_005707318.1 AP-1 complex subunit beta-1 [Galdieria sulphuraria]